MLFQGGFRSSRSSSSDSRGGGGAFLAIIIAIAAIAVAWLLSVVIRFALSRQREYLADAGSIELTKNPDAMITALRKIENRGELEDATSAVMEMCVDNPRSGFSDLFATHPSIESRVEAIVRFAGGHDPGPIELTEERRPQIDWDDPNIQRPSDGGTPPTPTQPGGDKPFLPSQPPVDVGSTSPPGQEAPGPWGPHRR
jgi:heat shock protein HtpX